MQQEFDVFEHLFRRQHRRGEMRLVLLFGLPRSGTTWLGKVFDSHPQTLYRHEPDSARSFGAVPLLLARSEAQAHRRAIEAFARTLPEIRSLRVTGKLPLFPKQYQRAGGYHIRKLLWLAARLAARLGIELPVPDMIDARAAAGICLVWKSIESLGRLGAIATVLADCRAVHIIRHPCGYVDSVLRGDAQGRFGSDVASSEDYGILELLLGTKPARDRSLDLESFKRLNPVERLAWKWALFNDMALEDIDGLPNCTWVRYEDLCSDPLTEYRKLFEFTGLPWDKQPEEFIRRSTSAENVTYYSVYKDPMKAADGWRQRMSVQDVERVMGVVEGTRSGALYLSDAS